MAEVQASTSRGASAAELVGEASCSGADASTYPGSVPSAIAAESPSFLTWMWIQMLTACSGVWGARGGGLSWPTTSGLASGAQRTQEDSESEVSSRIAASKSTWSEVRDRDTTSGLASGAQRTQEDSESEVSSQISASKSTWSEVRDRDIHHSVPIPCPSQLSIWEELKASNPHFFNGWIGDRLEVGCRIGEGAQAEIFEARVRPGREWDLVLKVFKLDAGFSLADLKHHWPCSPRKGGEDWLRLLGSNEFGSMQERSSKFVFEDIRANIDGKRCLIMCATLLKDGRFAFVMRRYWGDLRTLIDQKVKGNTHPLEVDLLSKNRGEQPPFSFGDSIHIMLQIARGVEGLYAEGVLHRDLKAANVLIGNPKDGDINCDVADYECAMFVKGTGFWRAPEVLRELQKRGEEDRNVDIWTEKVDVYSFGMTCYEILTGQIPFEGYTKSKWDDVIIGERPFLPHYVFPELRELVEACWHAQPSKRPSFEVVIVKLDLLWKEYRVWK